MVNVGKYTIHGCYDMVWDMFEGEIREIFRKYEHLQIGPCSIVFSFYWSLGVFSCGVLVGDQWSSSQGPATKEIRHLGFYLPEI